VEKLAAAIEKGSAKAAPAKKAKAAVKKAKAKAKVKAKAKAKPKKSAAKKKAPAAAKAKPAAGAAAPTMLDNIFGMISRSRNGITVERLKKRTGLQARQVSNALYKLTKKGKIETLSRGVYAKKKK
jgi:membrane protein involved in colicin uptake